MPPRAARVETVTVETVTIGFRSSHGYWPSADETARVMPNVRGWSTGAAATCREQILAAAIVLHPPTLCGKDEILPLIAAEPATPPEGPRNKKPESVATPTSKWASGSSRSH
jgi:hypothetical protein